MPTHEKSPLLTLRLSSQTLLDTELIDTLTGRSLYMIKTAGPYSTIARNDSLDIPTKAAEIKWPKVPPPPRSKKGKGDTDGVIIHIKGARWNGGETLLKYGSFSSSPRKFNIPNFSQSLKWKRTGNAYWCITSVVKGPIAIFTPATEFSRPQLQVFETLRDKYDSRSLLLYHGVSILLLDYLLITAMILVTDLQEWRSVEKQMVDITLDTPEQVRSVATPTSQQQWRKIAYGEPLFRKRSATLQPAPLQQPRTVAPASNNAYRQAIYSPPAPDLDSSSDSDDDNDLPQSLRSPSPSAESLFYPLTNGSAPSHGYLDPSFYNESGTPPVPALPSKYRESRRSGSSNSTPAPSPLQPPEFASVMEPLNWNRSQSTPPEVPPSRSNQYLAVAGPSSASGSLRSTDSRTHSINIRRLPQPPTHAGVASNSTIRHVQSYSRLTTSPLTGRTRDKRSSYSQRSLPPTPLAATFGPEEEVPAVPPLPAQHRMRKGDAYWMDELDEELPGRVRSTSFDVPPPAYHSHRFDAHGGFSVPMEDAGPEL